jgi:hypothetical protein
LRSLHVAAANAGWLETRAGRTTPAPANGHGVPLAEGSMSAPASESHRPFHRANQRVDQKGARLSVLSRHAGPAFDLVVEQEQLMRNF